MVDRARRVPAWAWLTVIVLASFLLRAWLARGMLAPFIMVDELIYSELARSIAADGALRVRDVPAAGFSVVYPLLISPAYAVFDNLPAAYAAVKTLNALFMSLAAVPAYFLARRVLTPPLSLVASLLAVALPSLVYTGTVMTENVFYPLFLTTALVLVLVLERPTPARQAVLLGLVVLAFGTRVQAVAIVPAILAAPLLLAVLQGRPLRATLRPFRALYAVILGAGLLVLAAQSARGRSVSDLVGAYSVVGEGDYEPAEVARFFLYHVAELDLYLGVLPFAAFVIVAALARRLGPSVGAFAAAGIALSVSLLLVVAAFASVFANRIQERNTFVVAPFFLIGLLVWVERAAPRPPALAGAAAIGTALLPLAIPFDRFIETGAISDTLAVLPIWAAFGSLLFDSIDATVLAGGALAAALFLLVPRRYALALPLVTLAFFAAMSHNVWVGERGFKQASGGALFQGIRTGDRDWIDDAVPDGAKVAIVWTGVSDRFVVNQNEFFNRSVGPIYYVGGPTPGGLAETEVRIDEDGGAVRLAGNDALDERYVLLDGTISPDRGVEVARDPGLGLTLWRLDEPLVSSQTEIAGLYPNDTWSGKRVTFTRRNCRGGTLSVAITSDPALFDQPQTVTARIAGRVAKRARIAPAGKALLHVPLRPQNGDCRVVFDVSETKVPAEMTNGTSTDTRELGAHFNDFHVTR
ncbi:MAG: glycosyltransferase family 39 protein [Actinobacteria bacterium]|nr:glycosyltransferase family 39 protein [Actinomycetota bacterium]